MKKLHFFTILTIIGLALFLVGCDSTKELKVVFESNGGSNVPSIVLTEANTITIPADPTREGYQFGGWYLSQSFKEEFDETTVVNGYIKLYAKWLLECQVVFKVNGETIITKEVVEGGALTDIPEVPARDGYHGGVWSVTDFSEVNDHLTVNGIYKVNVVFKVDGETIVTKEVVEGEALTDIPEVPSKVDYDGAWDVDDFSDITNEIVVNAVYTEKPTYKVTFVFDEDSSEEHMVKQGKSFYDYPAIPEVVGKIGTWSTYATNDVQGNMDITLVYEDIDPEKVTEYDWFKTYSVSGKTRYVFYSNMNVDFSSTFIKVEVLSETDLVTSNDAVLTIGHGEGHFLFKATLASGLSGVFYAEVIHNVTSFGFDENLTTFINMNSTIQGSSYINKTVAPYSVGTSNAFNIGLKAYSKTNLLSNDVVEYEYKYLKLVGAEWVEALEADILTRNQNALTFKNTVVGETFKIIILAKNIAKANSTSVLPVELIVNVNEGINVYTHDELKAAYANIDVHAIYLHGKITPTLADDQLNEDGSPLNYPEQTAFNRILAGQPTGNVYSRVANNVENNSLVVNGNYFTIDISALPVALPKSDGQGTNIANDPNFYITDVRVALFFNYLVNVNNELVEDENSVNYKNLTIIGNTITPEVDYSSSRTADQIQNDIELMSRNSGGYYGIVSVSSNVSTNNLVIDKTVIGVGSRGAGSVASVVDTTISYSWANACYVYGSKDFSITNCNLKYSGGAAIHMEDISPELNGLNDPKVTLDELTTIENWVSGEEAWFKAYSISSVVLSMKSTMEGGVNNFHCSLLKTMKDKDDNEAEMFNFVIFAKSGYSASDKDGNGEINLADNTTQYNFNICGYELERPASYLASSPLFAAAGADLRGIGSLSSAANMMALVQELTMTFMSLGQDQATAQSNAYLAATTASYLGNTSFVNPMLNNPVELTGYHELGTELPGFGSILFITEYMPNI